MYPYAGYVATLAVLVLSGAIDLHTRRFPHVLFCTLLLTSSISAVLLGGIELLAYNTCVSLLLTSAVLVFELLWRRFTGRSGQGMGDIKALFAVAPFNPVMAGISYVCAMTALAVAGVALKQEALPLLPFFAGAYALVSMAILFGM